MYLIASSTEMELRPLKKAAGSRDGLSFLVTGVGPVESAVSLTRFFESNQIKGLLLFGVGGAYPGKGVNVLDICSAASEAFGDFGVAIDNRIEYYTDSTLQGQRQFDLDNSLSKNLKDILTALKVPYTNGAFVTVNSCSGTYARGKFLRDAFDAICENMEGAVAARICKIYGTEMAEVRCISNMVEEYDPSKWKMKGAVARLTEVLIQVLDKIC